MSAARYALAAAVGIVSLQCATVDAAEWKRIGKLPGSEAQVSLDTSSIQHDEGKTKGWIKIEWPQARMMAEGPVKYVMMEREANCRSRKIATGVKIAYSSSKSFLSSQDEQMVPNPVPPETADEAMYKALCDENPWYGPKNPWKDAHPMTMVPGK